MKKKLKIIDLDLPSFQLGVVFGIAAIAFAELIKHL